MTLYPPQFFCKVTKDQELESALDAALEAGYRHFDTATRYKNEHIIGSVIKRWLQAGKVKREELFITTKVDSIILLEPQSEIMDSSLISNGFPFNEIQHRRMDFNILTIRSVKTSFIGHFKRTMLPKQSAE